MKITRLKKGYRITLSDSDFDMLAGFVSDGVQTYAGDEDAYQAYVSKSAKAAWTRRERGGGLMRIDEDRRATQPGDGGRS